MTRMDLAFFGRELARNPIQLKHARRIERDAKWGAWKDRIWWAITGLLLAASVAVAILAAVL